MEKFLPVAIVVVNYNTRELLSRCLVAVLKSEYLPAQLIVVDNASVDGSSAIVEQNFPTVTLLKSEKNLGFAKANNEAIRQLVNQPYIWLLNSDTEIGLQTLGQLYQYMESHPQIGGIVPQLVYQDGSFQSVGGCFPSVSNVFWQLFPIYKFLPLNCKKRLKLIANFPCKIEPGNLDLDYGTGAALFLRQAALDQVGLLGEEYFMYFEETDLCWRLKQKKWLIRAIATDPVMHVYGGSFKTKNDSARSRYFWQSLIIFVNKNYQGWQRSGIIMEIRLFSKLSNWLKSL